ncbi:MAG: HAMP domain-containing sensor histidine kinase [Pseudomonadota bacterium]
MEKIANAIRYRLVKVEKERRAAGQPVPGQVMSAESLGALRRIVTGISHELNTPVGNIILSSSSLKDEIDKVLQLVQDKQLSERRLIQCLDNCRLVSDLIERNGAQLGKLMINYKRLEIDERGQILSPFDLHTKVEETVAGLCPLIRQAGVTIDLHIAPDIAMRSYPRALDQVLAALVENSVQHGFSGIGQGHIRIGASRHGECVKLIYEDNGRGIEKPFQHKIFYPFHSTAICEGNSGLGLSVVHHLVTTMFKGTIALESESGAGVRFTLSFPMNAAGDNPPNDCVQKNSGEGML